jgi:hypothetical protein
VHGSSDFKCATELLSLLSQQCHYSDVMHWRMKLLSFLIMSALIAPAFSQEGQGYIVKLNNDTVVLKIIRLDRKKRSVNCEGHNNRRVSFKAEEVLGVKIDSSFYQSGRVRLKPLKKKRFVFLRNTVSGKLNLYEFNVKRMKLSWNAVGKNIITFR